MISERLKYLSERFADHAARGVPFSVEECRAVAPQLEFYSEVAERMENSTLAPQDEVLEAMVSDAA
jgi:hypothetical protein